MQPPRLLTCLTPELVSTGVHGTSKNMFPHSTKVNRIRVLAKKGQRLCRKGLKILGLCCCREVVLGSRARMNSRAVLLSPIVGFTLGKHNIYRQGWTGINTKLHKKVTLRTSLGGIIDFFFQVLYCSSFLTQDFLALHVGSSVYKGNTNNALWKILLFTLRT